MKKLSVLAVIAIAMVSMSSAFANNGFATTYDEPVTEDTVATSCQAQCPAAAAADTVATVQNDSVQ